MITEELFMIKQNMFGALNKKINISRINKIIPAYQKNLTPLIIGLKETIKWYEKKFF